ANSRSAHVALIASTPRRYTIVTHAKPVRIAGTDGQVTGVEFEGASGERFTVDADMVLKAIGQTLVPDGIAATLLTSDRTRIAVDADG
ncbi:hypothetical protein QM306_38360, partial [Burkholderia cenocepacia]|nr:hypothetical protein [Burkholderia cenocepacia]